jgi:hypothetical protein
MFSPCHISTAAGVNSLSSGFIATWQKVHAVCHSVHCKQGLPLVVSGQPIATRVGVG